MALRTAVLNSRTMHADVCRQRHVGECSELLPRNWLLTFLCQFNPLTPNDPNMGRTAPLTSRCCILYIYSTNIRTEYFKHAAHSPFFLFKMPFIS